MRKLPYYGSLPHNSDVSDQLHFFVDIGSGNISKDVPGEELEAQRLEVRLEQPGELFEPFVFFSGSEDILESGQLPPVHPRFDEFPEPSAEIDEDVFGFLLN